MFKLKKNIKLSMIIDLCEQHKIIVKDGRDCVFPWQVGDWIELTGHLIAAVGDCGEAGRSLWDHLWDTTAEIRNDLDEFTATNAYDIRAVLQWVEEHNGAILYDMDGIV